MSDQNPDLPQYLGIDVEAESGFYCCSDTVEEHAVAASQLQASKSPDSAFAETDVPQLPALQPVFRGNAATMRVEEPQRRGWFVGEFMSHPSLRTSAVEVKFGVHAVGEARTEWGGGRYTTLAILIKGRTRIEFPDQVSYSGEGVTLRTSPVLRCRCMT